MIVKVFANKGGGSGGASIDYLLGKDRKREGAEVLKGDPELSLAIVDSLEFKNSYTVGCLSFEEKELDDKTKHEIMEKFEKTVFPGFSEDMYNITWVEHSDKGRVELNFFIPNVEMTTQKRYQPYYDKVDRPLFDTFKKVINHDYALSSPDNPDKAQAFRARELHQPQSVKDIKADLGRQFAEMVEQGHITDRSQIVESLTAAGYEISRTTSKSISIKNPDGGRNIRLEGAIYGTELYNEISTAIKQFESPLGELKGIQAEFGKEPRRDPKEEIDEVRERYTKAVSYRQERNANLYKNSDRTANSSHNLDDRHRGDVVVGTEINGEQRSPESGIGKDGRREPIEVGENRSRGKGERNEIDSDSRVGSVHDIRGRQKLSSSQHSKEREDSGNESRDRVESNQVAPILKRKVFKISDLPPKIRQEINASGSVRELMQLPKFEGGTAPNQFLLDDAEQPIIKKVYDELSERIKQTIQRANEAIARARRGFVNLGRAEIEIDSRERQPSDRQRESNETDSEIYKAERRVSEAKRRVSDTERRIDATKHIITATDKAIKFVAQEIVEPKKVENDKPVIKEVKSTHETTSKLPENDIDHHQDRADTNSPNNGLKPSVREIDLDDDWDMDR